MIRNKHKLSGLAIGILSIMNEYPGIKRIEIMKEFFVGSVVLNKSYKQLIDVGLIRLTKEGYVVVDQGNTTSTIIKAPKAPIKPAAKPKPVATKTIKKTKSPKEPKKPKKTKEQEIQIQEVLANYEKELEENKTEGSDDYKNAKTFEDYQKRRELFNCNQYGKLIEHLKGQNNLKKSLDDILLIPKQITFKEFGELIRAIRKKRGGSGMIKALDALAGSADYYRGKKSLYVAMLEWR
jgi:hypothetical protein